jgi:CBS domain containing-hemolysin-like protein
MNAGLEWFKLGLVALLVMANGFFVAAEFSLVSVRRTRIEELVALGNADARIAQRAIQDPARFIAAVQVAITMAGLGLGWLGEPALADLFTPLFELAFGGLGAPVSEWAATAFTFIIITFVLIVLGELIPKSIALQRTEKTALFVAGPTLLAAQFFRPLIWALNRASNILLRLLGLDPTAEHNEVHSIEELKLLVDDSQEGGVLKVSEREMLHGVLDFGDTLANQVMIPRTEMICLSADATIEQAIQMAATHPLTKFPVYDNDLDHIVGILHTKDLAGVVHREGRRSATRVRKLVREALFVPETIHTSDLLVRFRTRKQHIAIVMDEYGGTAGLVTLSDLIEEIVGEVADVFDQAAPDIERLPDGSALINGLTPLEDVNDAFGLDLVEPNYETVAGYVLGRLGRVAQVGDEVEAGSVRLRVEAMDKLRIARVRLTRR